ncbi:hypothetical protein [Microbacterium sp. KNMS]
MSPTIEWVRDGVGFTPPAAASFRRLEADLGRQVDVNSTFRDPATQDAMYRAWQDYVNGRGPYPGHSRALPASESVHCQGEALDSDDWTTPGFIALAAEHGWIRTAAWDPTEQHHFEYQASRDEHRGEQPQTTTTGEPDMFVIRDKSNGNCFMVDYGRIKHIGNAADLAAARAAFPFRDVDNRAFRVALIGLDIPYEKAVKGADWRR